MRIHRNALLALALGPALLLAAPAGAQQPAANAPNPGRDLIAAKCSQCHTDSMFRDGRQDRRAWEATIYRMVGRGGLFTQDEIKTMADYLGAAQGPDVPRTFGGPRGSAE